MICDCSVIDPASAIVVIVMMLNNSETIISSDNFGFQNLKVVCGADVQRTSSRMIMVTRARKRAADSIRMIGRM